MIWPQTTFVASVGVINFLPSPLVVAFKQDPSEIVIEALSSYVETSPKLRTVTHSMIKSVLLRILNDPTSSEEVSHLLFSDPCLS